MNRDFWGVFTFQINRSAFNEANIRWEYLINAEMITTLGLAPSSSRSSRNEDQSIVLGEPIDSFLVKLAYFRINMLLKLPR